MNTKGRNNLKRDRSPDDGPRRQRRVGGGRYNNSPYHNNGTNKRVYVSNLPYHYRWQDLKDLFRSNVGEVSFAEVLLDDMGESRGCGIVEFDSPALVTVAIQKLHQFLVEGRKIIVKPNDDQGDRRRDDAHGGDVMGPSFNPVDQWGRQEMHNTGPVDTAVLDSQVNWGETYGLSHKFLLELDIRGPLMSRVFIANLDFAATRKKLKQVFKLAGKIVDVELAVNSEGTSRGFATVEYDHPVEAVQAISMFHNQYLYERRMTVRMDKKDRNNDILKLPEGLRGIGMGLGANGNPLFDVAKNLHSIVGSNNPNPPNNMPAPVNLTNAVQAQLGMLNNVGNIQMRPNEGNVMQQSPMAPFKNQFTGSVGPGAGAFPPADEYRSSGPGFGDGAPRFGGGMRSESPQAQPFTGGGGGMRYSGGSDVFSDKDNRGPFRGPVSDTILVKNLPFGSSSELLYNLYSTYGRVSFSEMRGADVGIVRYFNDADAEVAQRQTNGKAYKDRRLVVTFHS